ncbi:Phytocyanin domain [Dillenia turbinata]|uniref:Basic blue protein n=1 Tax=Dillenia turbinata TaxID=194707 RepID=A0AAN8VQG4_9MAGN
MSQGRGSAVGATVLVAALVCLWIQAEVAHGATYVVGGSQGWTFNVVNWPKGKSFKAGDTLIFNYDKTIHNVVVVNRAGYSGCSTPSGAKVYSSGKDQIKLAKGQSYFICSYAGHCQSGMKIAVNAA